MPSCAATSSALSLIGASCATTGFWVMVLMNTLLQIQIWSIFCCW